MKVEPLVISLGGSFVAPKDEFGTQRHIEILRNYLKWFQTLSKDRLVIVVVGGGQTARAWMDVAKRVQPKISDDGLDWIGIEASRLNARVLQALAGAAIVGDLITDPRVVLKQRRGLIFGAGWKPGRSTDYDAVMLAVKNKATTVYNLSNIPGVYTRDPHKFKDAKKLSQVSWKDLQTIIGRHWLPGLSMPFDPIAAQLASKKGLTVKIVNGWSFINVQKALRGQTFLGTTVHP